MLGSGERATWHLAAASDGPDTAIAAELESTGNNTLARGGYATAGHAYERAAGSSPEDAERLRRTLLAGRAYWLDGNAARADSLLESVRELATEPKVRADLQALRGAVRLYSRPGQTCTTSFSRRRSL